MIFAVESQRTCIISQQTQDSQTCWRNMPSGVNFINILRAAFTRVGPKSAKIHSSCQSFLCFWDKQKQKLLIEHWWNWHQEPAYSTKLGFVKGIFIPFFANELNHCIVLYCRFIFSNVISCSSLKMKISKNKKFSRIDSWFLKVISSSSSGLFFVYTLPTWDWVGLVFNLLKGQQLVI